jgi:hypothetical protein
MTAKTKLNGSGEETVNDNSSMLSELVTTLHKMVDLQSDLLRQQKEHDDLIYRFMFIGDPEKGTPPFVTEVRDGLAWINGFRAGTQRAAWIILGVLITTGVGALIIYRFPVTVIGSSTAIP